MASTTAVRAPANAGPFRVRTLRAWVNVTPTTDNRGRVIAPPVRTVVGVGSIVQLEDALLVSELCDCGKAERVPIETPLSGAHGAPGEEARAARA